MRTVFDGRLIRHTSDKTDYILTLNYISHLLRLPAIALNKGGEALVKSLILNGPSQRFLFNILTSTNYSITGLYAHTSVLSTKCILLSTAVYDSNAATVDYWFLSRVIDPPNSQYAKEAIYIAWLIKYYIYDYRAYARLVLRRRELIHGHILRTLHAYIHLGKPKHTSQYERFEQPLATRCEFQKGIKRCEPARRSDALLYCDKL